MFGNKIYIIEGIGWFLRGGNPPVRNICPARRKKNATSVVVARVVHYVIPDSNIAQTILAFPTEMVRAPLGFHDREQNPAVTIVVFVDAIVVVVVVVVVGFVVPSSASFVSFELISPISSVRVVGATRSCAGWCTARPLAMRRGSERRRDGVVTIAVVVVGYTITGGRGK